MDKRTKILTIVFGAAAAYAGITSVVYPRWIKPLLTIDEQVAERQAEYDTLLEFKEEVDSAKGRYKAAITRTGSFDIAAVETDVRGRLNKLIDEYQLQDAKVTPGRPSRDRKTGVEKMRITVRAVGTLESAVEFLRAISEFPQLARVGNPRIYPASRSSKDKGLRRMNVSVPIDLLVLPAKTKFVGRIVPGDTPQPDAFVRHQGHDYSVIWSGKPFTEPIPLRVTCRGPVKVRKPGRSASLSAKATGGDRDYQYEWEPPEGLSDPKSPNPKVDTSEPGTREFTVTVTCGTGEVATATQKVTVQEPQEVDRRGGKVVPPPQEIEPKGPKKPTRWKDGRYLQYTMSLLTSVGTEQVNKVMLFNNRDKQTTYYTVGDEFDGGELKDVQPRGALVCRSDGYFIYPIGERLTDSFNADEVVADDYPSLKNSAAKLREAAEEEAAKAAADKAAAAKPDASAAAKAGDAAKKDGDQAKAAPEAEGPAKETRRPAPSRAPTRRVGRKPAGGKEAGPSDATNGGVEIPFNPRSGGKRPAGAKRGPRKRPPQEKKPEQKPEPKPEQGPEKP